MVITIHYLPTTVVDIGNSCQWMINVVSGRFCKGQYVGAILESFPTKL